MYSFIQSSSLLYIPSISLLPNECFDFLQCPSGLQERGLVTNTGITAGDRCLSKGLLANSFVPALKNTTKLGPW